jgi:hypothetical protein
MQQCKVAHTFQSLYNIHDLLKLNTSVIIRRMADARRSIGQELCLFNYFPPFFVRIEKRFKRNKTRDEL